MDTITTYREIIKQVISDYAKLHPSHGNIRLDVIFDEMRDRYALMQVGWDRGRRVRGNLIYVVIENGKVIIEYDGMESGITQDLVNQGIPEHDIVLAFIEESQAFATV
ncbi:XisI protein [Nostoc parmelioides]|uniref:XisI protein n=1 Tax=Nostoc parmelioides FACHB-3921 TaxID=2692909 RepID=A0ABR8BLG0_9NOSO|nr:XisI protein [Nostoc parmelioides]MBD2254701.1 XisI protein [Nostoc parmelioides FACHB-3921]